MGGNIYVKSTIKQGSTFTVELPVTTAEENKIKWLPQMPKEKNK